MQNYPWLSPPLTSQILRNGVLRGYLLTRNSSDLRPVRPRCFLSGSVAGEVLPIRPDSKDLRDFSRLRVAFNRGFEPRISYRV